MNITSFINLLKPSAPGIKPEPARKQTPCSPRHSTTEHRDVIQALSIMEFPSSCISYILEMKGIHVSPNAVGKAIPRWTLQSAGSKVECPFVILAKAVAEWRSTCDSMNTEVICIDGVPEEDWGDLTDPNLWVEAFERDVAERWETLQAARIEAMKAIAAAKSYAKRARSGAQTTQ